MQDGERGMDFSVPDELQGRRERIGRFVHDDMLPLA